MKEGHTFIGWTNEEGNVLTKDLKGNATTNDFTNEIIKKMGIV